MLKRENRLPWLVLFALLLVLCAVVAYGFVVAPSWFYHPLGVCSGPPAVVRNCKGYNFHSGIEANIAELAVVASIVGAIIGLVKHRNCHEHGCPRLCWHPHPDHGHPICKVHHPHQIVDGQVVDKATGTVVNGDTGNA